MKKITDHYSKSFQKYGADPRSLSWSGKGAAHQRFRQFWAEIDFNDKSVLDVGCGFGELGKFITKRYEHVDYLGVDIMSEFIAEAKKQHPHLEFETRDYISDPLDQKFDVVIASGILNSDLGEDTMAYRKKAIKVLFEHTKKVCAFNMLGGYPQPKTPQGSNVWYADSLEILEYCMSLTRRVILRQNYHPKDFTIFMYPVKKRMK